MSVYKFASTRTVPPESCVWAIAESEGRDRRRGIFQEAMEVVVGLLLKCALIGASHKEQRASCLKLRVTSGVV